MRIKEARLYPDQRLTTSACQIWAQTQNFYRAICTELVKNQFVIHLINDGLIVPVVRYSDHVQTSQTASLLIVADIVVSGPSLLRLTPTHPHTHHGPRTHSVQRRRDVAIWKSPQSLRRFHTWDHLPCTRRLQAKLRGRCAT